MGKIFSLFFKRKPIKITMIGLDNAGKSTILYRLKIGDSVETIPTLGFNVEVIKYKKLSMTMFDVGGQDQIRQLWKFYLKDTDAIIFVVDSADKDRFEEAKNEIHKTLSDETLQNVKVLIYLNKQDLGSAVRCEEMTKILNLENLKQKDWKVQGCSAIRGEGLYEGLDWLSKKL